MDMALLGNALATKSAFVGLPQSLNPLKNTHKEDFLLPLFKTEEYPEEKGASFKKTSPRTEGPESQPLIAEEAFVRVSPGLVARIDDAYRKQKSKSSASSSSPLSHLARMLEVEYRQNEKDTPLRSRQELRDFLGIMKPDVTVSRAKVLWGKDGAKSSGYDFKKAESMMKNLEEASSAFSPHTLDLVA
ncbi:MAG: hypothetical protein V2A78_00320 [bacterium]